MSSSALWERMLLVALPILLVVCACESRAVGEPEPANAALSPSPSSGADGNPPEENTVTVNKVALVELVRNIVKRILVEAELKNLQARHAADESTMSTMSGGLQPTVVDKRRMSINTMFADPVFMSKLRNVFQESLPQTQYHAATIHSSNDILSELLKQLAK